MLYFQDGYPLAAALAATKKMWYTFHEKYYLAALIIRYSEQHIHAMTYTHRLHRQYSSESSTETVRRTNTFLVHRHESLEVQTFSQIVRSGHLIFSQTMISIIGLVGNVCNEFHTRAHTHT